MTSTTENIEEIHSCIRAPSANEFDFPKIKADYCHRGLDLCHFCGLQFNVGERIPRIIVGCGHTFCTSCLTYFLRNNRIRCPMCRKLLKGVESVDKLPLNFNILYEVVTNDPLLSSVNFERCLQADLDLDEEDETYQRELEPYLCQNHDQRIKHFYCSEHPSIFCRECIKDLHNSEACFVVDLYEIEKMRKLQEQNINLNKKQLIKRHDGASKSCVEEAEKKVFENPLLKESQARREQRQNAKQDNIKKALFQNNSGAPVRDISGVEFDAAQFDGQGTSNRQFGQMGHVQQNFHPNQQYAQQLDDSYDEEDQSSSGRELEEGELNSAQKQKLKRDLLMMGYDEDEEFGDDINEQQLKSLVHDPAMVALTAMPLDGNDSPIDKKSQDDMLTPEQIQMKQEKLEALVSYEMQQQQRQQMAEVPVSPEMILAQQQQFKEAMEIQMAMKQQMQQPLRVKQRNSGMEQGQDQELTQEEKFALDKKLFAQQLKEELLYGKKGPEKKKQEQEQEAYEKLDADDEEEFEEDEGQSYDDEIEAGEALVLNQEDYIDTPRDPVPFIDPKVKAKECIEESKEVKQKADIEEEKEEQKEVPTEEQQQLILNGTDSAMAPLGNNSSDECNKAPQKEEPDMAIEEKKVSSNSADNSNNTPQPADKQMKENTAPDIGTTQT